MTKTTKKTRSLFSGLLTWGRPDNNRLGTSGEFAYKNNRLSRVDRNAMQASQTVPLAVSGARWGHASRLPRPAPLTGRARHPGEGHPPGGLRGQGDHGPARYALGRRARVALPEPLTPPPLAVSGQVWMWGNGMARPAREERLDVRVTQIAAGSAHFVAVTGPCPCLRHRVLLLTPRTRTPATDERTRNLFSWGANTCVLRTSLLPSCSCSLGR